MFTFTGKKNLNVTLNNDAVAFLDLKSNFKNWIPVDLGLHLVLVCFIFPAWHRNEKLTALAGDLVISLCVHGGLFCPSVTVTVQIGAKKNIENKHR